MTAAEYTEKLRALTVDFEESQGTFIQHVNITQDDMTPYLEITITLKD